MGAMKDMLKRENVQMAKYIGPKSKISRKFGEPIFGHDKVLARRNFPPGQQDSRVAVKNRNMPNS